MVANINSSAIHDLKKLVAEGEGLQLEFKRKAAYPDKVVRELIAFANTEGGTLLIGVDDDGSIPGTKYPEEELHVVQEALKKFCRPALVFHATTIRISENRSVVRIDVPQSERRPHALALSESQREYTVRYEDKSVKATKEMKEIIQRSKKKKDIRFVFGEPEKKLMQFLEHHPKITLSQFQKLTGLNRFRSARKLILLVLANVLKIHPTEKGDLYERK